MFRVIAFYTLRQYGYFAVSRTREVFEFVKLDGHSHFMLLVKSSDVVKIFSERSANISECGIYANFARNLNVTRVFNLLFLTYACEIC